MAVDTGRLIYLYQDSFLVTKVFLRMESSSSFSSSSSIDSTTLGGSWSVRQFYSTLVYPQSSPSSQ